MYGFDRSNFKQFKSICFDLHYYVKLYRIFNIKNGIASSHCLKLRLEKWCKRNHCCLSFSSLICVLNLLDQTKKKTHMNHAIGNIARSHIENYLYVHKKDLCSGCFFVTFIGNSIYLCLWPLKILYIVTMAMYLKSICSSVIPLFSLTNIYRLEEKV